MADSCGEPITVTVTQTIFQGAATSTTNALTSLLLTTDDQASSIAFGLLVVVSDSTLTTMAPPTTLTLNLVHATSSSRISTTVQVSSTTSKCPKATASRAAVSAALKPSTPPSTIAGGVIGSVAGVGLLIALLLYCCKRKRKINFKRKVQKTHSDEQSHALEAARQEKDDAVRQLEQARQSKPLPSPRSFDFGLPKIEHSTSPVKPQRWI